MSFRSYKKDQEYLFHIFIETLKVQFYGNKQGFISLYLQPATSVDFGISEVMNLVFENLYFHCLEVRRVLFLVKYN